jgi:hypothetical protein
LSSGNELPTIQLVENNNNMSNEIHTGIKKSYIVTFEDTFSFATTQRCVAMTEHQYAKAVLQMNDKVIVVVKFDKTTQINWQFIIKKIEIIKQEDYETARNN